MPQPAKKQKHVHSQATSLDNSDLIPYSQFTQQAEIGTGAFSVVRTAVWKHNPVVVKLVQFVDKRNKGIDEKDIQSVIEEFRTEGKTIKTIHHPNVVRFWGFIKEKVFCCCFLIFL